MATPKQLREIFAPILAEHRDLVLRRRWLFRPPIQTAVIGIFIDRTSSANNSRMALSVVPLSRFNTPSVLGFEDAFEVERVIGAPPPERWSPLQKDGPPRIYQDMFDSGYQAHLVRNFNAKARPFFDQVRSFDDVVAWIRRFREPPLRKGAIESIDGWIAAMQGNFSTAADQLQALFNRIGPPWRGVVGDNRQLEQDILKVLRSGDRSAIASFLHGMEERTIASYGLERFWCRNPFPFEGA